MANILLIDDENNIRLMIRLALQHDGHTLETATDGVDGLEKFGDGHGWDVVLLDHRMPGPTGLDVLKDMRKRKPHARVIMITAFGTIDLFHEAMDAGATDFLRKPFTIETLRRSVEAAIAKRPPLADEQAAVMRSGKLTYSSTTLNGYRILYHPGTVIKTPGESLYSFVVRAPNLEEEPCTVLLPDYLVDLIKAYTNHEQFPGAARFWEALCEETLGNYVWQNAAVPEGGVLRISEMTDDIKRWVTAVINRTAP